MGLIERILPFQKYLSRTASPMFNCGIWGRLCITKRKTLHHRSGILAGIQSTEIRIIYLQRKEFRLFPKGADQSGPTAHAAQSVASVNAELSEGLRTEVGQLVLLPVRPEILDRV